MHLRSVCSMLLCLSLLAPLFTAGCSTRSNGTIADLRGAFSERSVNAAIDVLASAGVAVYDAPGSSEPVQPIKGAASALRFTRWQARTMALESTEHGGFLGAQIDALTKLPKTVPPLSYFLAAWVSGYDSAGARLARDLMGPQDWKQAPQVVFPTIVLALFVADASRGETKGTIGAPGLPGLAMILVPIPAIRFADGPESALGLCSAISGFVDSTLTSIFNVLRSQGSESFWSVLRNVAVSFAQGVVVGLITVFTKPIVSLLETAAGILATATMVVSYLRPWKVTVQAEPASNRFSVGTEAQIEGRLKLQVTTSGEGLDWPPDVLDCAKSLGQDLTTVAFDDSKISWHVDHGIPEFADKISADTKLASDKTAYFTYHTQNESVEAAKGTPKHGSLGVTANLERGAVQKLADLINGTILNQLPKWIADIVKPIFAPRTAAAINALAPFLHAQNGTAVSILYHEKNITPPPKPIGRVDPCSLIDAGTANILGATFVIGPVPSSVVPGMACMAGGKDYESGGHRVGGGWVLIAVITPDDLRRRASGIAAMCMQEQADTVSKCNQVISGHGEAGASAVKNGVLITAMAIHAGSNHGDLTTERAVVQHALTLLR